MRKIVPMIHVPDVRAAATWYRDTLGFTIDGTNEEDGVLNWASLSLGDSEIMFNEGGRPSDAHRREFDVYIHVDDVDALHARLKDRVEVVEPPHDTFYGMHELIIRDCNRFWITFGQAIVGG